MPRRFALIRCRLLALLLGAAAALAAAAAPIQVVEAPRGLAGSSLDVATATGGPADQVMREARAQHGAGCRSHCAMIARVWQRLLPVVERQRRLIGGRHRISLQVVQSERVDAFAVPDGRIMLSEAFVRAHAMDDAQLAFVLAHEAAHVLLEHERQVLNSALALLPRNVPRSVADMYVEMEFDFGLLKRLEPSMQQSELEADETGSYLAALAGYHPRRQRVFMEREAARATPHANVAATHPSAAQRLARLHASEPLALRLHEAAGKAAPGARKR